MVADSSNVRGGKLGGAGLDVFTSNLVPEVLQNAASVLQPIEATLQTRIAMGQLVVDNIDAITPKTLLTPA